VSAFYGYKTSQKIIKNRENCAVKEKKGYTQRHTHTHAHTHTRTHTHTHTHTHTSL